MRQSSTSLSTHVTFNKICSSLTRGKKEGTNFIRISFTSFLMTRDDQSQSLLQKIAGHVIISASRPSPGPREMVKRGESAVACFQGKCVNAADENLNSSKSDI